MSIGGQDSLHLRQVLHYSKDLLPLLVALCGVGCVHDPLEISCPELGPGDLVVTEIHGPQSGEDRYGEWIEVFNSSDKTVDLSGLAVRLIKLDGSSSEKLLVRTPVSLESGKYGVFGRQFPGSEPDYVNYGYSEDVDRDIYDTGAVELSSCGVVLDVAVYRNLPSRGSFALSGAIDPPDAEANDDELNWCRDTLEDEDTEQFGIRGTPQKENPVCPS